MKKAAFFTLLFISLESSAQLRHLFDTIKYDLTKKGKFFLELDGKNNVVSDIKIKMFGIQGGYIYNDRTSFYIGFYNTYGHADTIISSNPTSVSPKIDSNSIISKYGMGYINFGCEYMFHDSKRWRLSIPAGIGIGAGKQEKYAWINHQRKAISITHPGILPLEMGINASYKLTWWLWLGGGLGTRISLNSTHQFNGPFYTFGLQFQTDAVIKKVTKAIKEYREMR